MSPFKLKPYKNVFIYIHKVISITVLVAFLLTSIKGPSYAQSAQPGAWLNLPVPGVLVHLSPEFTPAHLLGMTIHPDNALQFDFLIHKGQQDLDDTQRRAEYKKLVKYFLASLTIPDEDQWVNLSPYEKNRIIKDDFGKTEMGRDLLAQDYMLKQITSSMIYPEDGLGKKFWDRIYARAWEQYHTTDVPVNTFNKVWIVPDMAIVYESGNSAYILHSHLKVMLEEDYLSLEKHSAINNTHCIGSQVIREIILPELEKEVNGGKNFANLRQMFSGMILATWYKKALKESLLGKIYADKAKVKGMDQDPKTNEEIYKRYLKAFKKGVFNYIKEDVDKYSNEAIPRKYFSGGVTKGFVRGAVPVVSGKTFAQNGPQNAVFTVNEHSLAFVPGVDRPTDMNGVGDNAALVKIDLTSAGELGDKAMIKTLMSIMFSQGEGEASAKQKPSTAAPIAPPASEALLEPVLSQPTGPTAAVANQVIQELRNETLGKNLGEPYFPYTRNISFLIYTRSPDDFIRNVKGGISNPNDIISPVSIRLSDIETDMQERLEGLATGIGKKVKLGGTYVPVVLDASGVSDGEILSKLNDLAQGLGEFKQRHRVIQFILIVTNPQYLEIYRTDLLNSNQFILRHVGSTRIFSQDKAMSELQRGARIREVNALYEDIVNSFLGSTDAGRNIQAANNTLYRARHVLENAKDRGERFERYAAQIQAIIDVPDFELEDGSPKNDGTDKLDVLKRLFDDLKTKIETDRATLSETIPTVLLIDDETNWLELGRDYFEGAGFKVVEASSGAAALKMITEEGLIPDFILTDVDYKTHDGMNGIKFAEKLNTMEGGGYSGIPVLIHTTEPESHAQEKLPANVVGPVLSKSVSIGKAIMIFTSIHEKQNGQEQGAVEVLPAVSRTILEEANHSLSRILKMAAILKEKANEQRIKELTSELSSILPAQGDQDVIALIEIQKGDIDKKLAKAKLQVRELHERLQNILTLVKSFREEDVRINGPMMVFNGNGDMVDEQNPTAQGKYRLLYDFTNPMAHMMNFLEGELYLIVEAETEMTTNEQAGKTTPSIDLYIQGLRDFSKCTGPYFQMLQDVQDLDSMDYNDLKERIFRDRTGEEGRGWPEEIYRFMRLAVQERAKTTVDSLMNEENTHGLENSLLLTYQTPREFIEAVEAHLTSLRTPLNLVSENDGTILNVKVLNGTEVTGYELNRNMLSEFAYALVKKISQQYDLAMFLPEAEKNINANHTVLVVEGDPAKAGNISNIFTMFGGFKVEVVENGAAALKMIEEGDDPNKYLALVTADKMPGEEGVQVAQEVSKRNRKLPVFIYTEEDDVTAGSRNDTLHAQGALSQVGTIVSRRSFFAKSGDILNSVRVRAQREQQKLDEARERLFNEIHVFRSVILADKNMDMENKHLLSHVISNTIAPLRFPSFIQARMFSLLDAAFDRFTDVSKRENTIAWAEAKILETQEATKTAVAQMEAENLTKPPAEVAQMAQALKERMQFAHGTNYDFSLSLFFNSQFFRRGDFFTPRLMVATRALRDRYMDYRRARLDLEPLPPVQEEVLSSQQRTARRAIDTLWHESESGALRESLRQALAAGGDVHTAVENYVRSLGIDLETGEVVGTSILGVDVAVELPAGVEQHAMAVSALAQNLAVAVFEKYDRAMNAPPDQSKPRGDENIRANILNTRALIRDLMQEQLPPELSYALQYLDDHLEAGDIIPEQALMAIDMTGYDGLILFLSSLRGIPNWPAWKPILIGLRADRTKEAEVRETVQERMRIGPKHWELAEWRAKVAALEKQVLISLDEQPLLREPDAVAERRLNTELKYVNEAIGILDSQNLPQAKEEKGPGLLSRFFINYLSKIFGKDEINDFMDTYWQNHQYYVPIYTFYKEEHRDYDKIAFLADFVNQVNSLRPKNKIVLVAQDHNEDDSLIVGGMILGIKRKSLNPLTWKNTVDEAIKLRAELSDILKQRRDYIGQELYSITGQKPVETLDALKESNPESFILFEAFVREIPFRKASEKARTELLSEGLLQELGWSLENLKTVVRSEEYNKRLKYVLDDGHSATVLKIALDPAMSVSPHDLDKAVKEFSEAIRNNPRNAIAKKAAAVLFVGFLDKHNEFKLLPTATYFRDILPRQETITTQDLKKWESSFRALKTELWGGIRASLAAKQGRKGVLEAAAMHEASTVTYADLKRFKDIKLPPAFRRQEKQKDQIAQAQEGSPLAEIALAVIKGFITAQRIKKEDIYKNKFANVNLLNRRNTIIAGIIRDTFIGLHKISGTNFFEVPELRRKERVEVPLYLQAAADLSPNNRKFEPILAQLETLLPQYSGQSVFIFKSQFLGDFPENTTAAELVNALSKELIKYNDESQRSGFRLEFTSLEYSTIDQWFIKISIKDKALMTILPTISAKSPVQGGIDFNAAHMGMQIKRDGRGVVLPINQQDMAQLNSIQGFIPEIIEISPAVNVPIINELQQKLQTSLPAMANPA